MQLTTRTTEREVSPDELTEQARLVLDSVRTMLGCVLPAGLVVEFTIEPAAEELSIPTAWKARPPSLEL